MCACVYDACVYDVCVYDPPVSGSREAMRCPMAAAARGLRLAWVSFRRALRACRVSRKMM